MPLDHFLLGIALVMILGSLLARYHRMPGHYYLSCAAIMCLSVLFVRFFFWELAHTKGPSMMPTMTDSSWIVINKQAYRFPSSLIRAKSTPIAPEIVAIEWERELLIKRVRATFGDRIKLSPHGWFINNVFVAPPSSIPSVWTNQGGFRLHSSYDGMMAKFNIVSQWNKSKSFEVEVPYGYIFVLGDNVQESLDSRSLGWVPVSHVVGRVDYITSYQGGS